MAIFGFDPSVSTIAIVEALRVLSEQCEAIRSCLLQATSKPERSNAVPDPVNPEHGSESHRGHEWDHLVSANGAHAGQ